MKMMITIHVRCIFIIRNLLNALNIDSELGKKKTLKRKSTKKYVAIDEDADYSEEWKTDDSDWEKYEKQRSKKKKKGF